MTITERHRRALVDAEAGWNIAAIYDDGKDLKDSWSTRMCSAPTASSPRLAVRKLPGAGGCLGRPGRGPDAPPLPTRRFCETSVETFWGQRWSVSRGYYEDGSRSRCSSTRINTIEPGSHCTRQRDPAEPPSAHGGTSPRLSGASSPVSPTAASRPW